MSADPLLAHPRLFVTIVLDGVGIGAAPDAGEYGDEDADTLGHIVEKLDVSLPNLTRLGLGCIRPLRGVESVQYPGASFGRMRERAAGKDSTSGHWELAGLRLEKPFPLYPDGFPEQLLEMFRLEAGVDGVLGNVAASGTEIIARHGAEHLRSGFPIVYTSADSVFQVAAHIDAIPLDRLYAICHAARERVLTGRHAVGRVIARPFEGHPGMFERISAARRDFSLKPPGPALPQVLGAAGVETVSVGKVADLFAGIGFSRKVKTRSNEEGTGAILSEIRRHAENPADRFVWANLVDFDQEFGHRNNPEGFARALEAFDMALPELTTALPTGARLCITADHGNDPTTPGTDHTRELVPLLYFDGRTGRDLGVRDSFCDHAATALAYFGVPSGERARLVMGASFE